MALMPMLEKQAFLRGAGLKKMEMDWGTWEFKTWLGILKSKHCLNRNQYLRVRSGHSGQMGLYIQFVNSLTVSREKRIINSQAE